jgi:arylsulfatase A-like enzyme/Flp pilus assembly protein TadD
VHQASPLPPHAAFRSRFALPVAALVIVSIAVWFVAGRLRPRVERSADRNVLLITIDTLRADAIGVAGGRARTPNLDRLVAAGVRFTAAHSHAVVTLPSHASILTGLYPFEHGLRDNSGYQMATSVPTLATRLKHDGFATAAFVGAFPLDVRFGLSHGFDVYDDRYGDTNRVSDLLMPERRADTVVAAAVQWIRAQREKWFVWVHVYDPHAPYRPPSPFDREYAGEPYAGEVAFTDAALGPLLDAARAATRPLVTIVTADHGESLGHHGEDTHGLFAYEDTLHVPLLLSMPSLTARVIDTPVRHVDIAPTILDALSTKADGVSGRSLLPLIEGTDTADRPAYFEALSAALNRGWAPLRGVIAGGEKYIDLPIPELYDIRADPQEVHNLLSARPDRERVLRARLDAFGPTSPATAARRAGDADTARLLSLGYLSGSAAIKAHYGEADDPKRLVDIDRQLQSGVTLFQRGQLQDALDVFESLTRARPDMALAYLHDAYIKWELGDAAGAIATLESARARGATSPDLDTQLGIYLAEAGDVSRALSILASATNQSSPDPEALNGIGIARARVNDARGAIEAFRRVLEIDPSNAAAYQNIGTVNLQRGDLNAARQAFTEALALDPQMAGAYNGLGVAAMRSGQRDAAITAWERAVTLDGRQFDTLFNLGVTLMDAGDETRARPYLERFAATAPVSRYARDLEEVRRLLGRR